jgi:hypothetical protein
VSDMQAADFDAIIFECGQPLDEDDPEAVRLVHEAVEQNKVLAAICMMPVLLASAGVLEGKHAVCNDEFTSVLKAGGAIPSDAQIERDGNIITASFRGHRLFGEAIAEALAETTAGGAVEPVDVYVAYCGYGGCPKCPNYGTTCDGCLTDGGALAQYAVNCVVRSGRFANTPEPHRANTASAITLAGGCRPRWVEPRDLGAFGHQRKESLSGRG